LKIRGDEEMVITLSDVLTVIRKIIDISLVWLIFYFILKNIKNNVKLSLIVKGLIFIIILKFVSEWLNLVTVGYLLDYIIQWGPIALVVIFQPEIRTILEQLGRNQLLGRHKVLTVDEREHVVYEIVNAVDYMRKERVGALIVIERDISLGNYIDKAKKIYADLTSDLLIAIFYEGNPLHDGGVIIQGDRITCAGAVFPTSNSPKLNRRLGTRHRAALGLSEETDAICLVVSEETGRVSIALKGEMLYNLSLDDVRMMLIDELKPKQNEDYDEEDEDNIDEEEIYEKDR
jgi:diadenylate cyclase